MELAALLAKAVGAVICVYVLLTVVTQYLQRKLLYFPDTQRVTPAQYNLPGVEERALKTPDGGLIFTWWGQAQPGYPTLLYFHGNAGSLGARAERIRKYMSRGYGVVIMTYRGYGGSSGSPSERVNVADATLVYQTLIDSGVAGESIVLYGESLGSGVAVQLAAGHPVAGVILDAPYTSVVDLAALHHPYLPARWLMTDRYETLAHMARVRAPLLVVHGEADDIIPVEMGRRVATAADGRAEVVTFPGAGHSDHHLYGSYEVITAWLEQRRTCQRDRAVS